MRVRGGHADAVQQLDAVRSQFTGLYVSPVYEVEPGVFGWAICTACPTD
ncbi:MAG TPA: hypothetical protein VHZ49_22495 [Methylomirabilota bacterium]|nr:hypothetical protein [Methylomirabilota bacterium]